MSSLTPKLARIYVSTYIENGSVTYDHILKRKKRLRSSWNIIIACAYTVCIMIINFFVVAAHQQLKFEEIYKFFTTFFCIEKGIELLAEIFCYFIFMKSWDNKTYRIETAILILLQSTLVFFLVVEHLELFLKSGILSIQKLSSVIFLDSYILCLLVKEFHKIRCSHQCT